MSFHEVHGVQQIKQCYNFLLNISNREIDLKYVSLLNTEFVFIKLLMYAAFFSF